MEFWEKIAELHIYITEFKKKVRKVWNDIMELWWKKFRIVSLYQGILCVRGGGGGVSELWV